MTINAAANSFDLSPPRREPIDLPEPRRQDKSLPKLIAVHSHRLERLELESKQARREWRGARAEVRRVKEEWRAAKQAAQDFWRNARAEFFQMLTTSGQVRRCKATYERQKVAAEAIRLDARKCAQLARRCGKSYFLVKAQVQAAYVRREKFTILHDVMRKKNMQTE